MCQVADAIASSITKKDSSMQLSLVEDLSEPQPVTDDVVPVLVPGLPFVDQRAGLFGLCFLRY